MTGSILLTGGSGKLGSAIRASRHFPSVIAPSHQELDITERDSVFSWILGTEFETVIHCAAFARMGLCEKEPEKAVRVNVMGTANMVEAVIEKQHKTGRNIRFIHISTDGVYAGVSGNYQEDGPANPYNIYGWTKLSAECAVRVLPDHCIVRTSFFDPENIPFATAAEDAFSSKIPLPFLVDAIHLLADSGARGVINVGEERRSEFKRYREYKPSIRPCRFESVLRSAAAPLAKDASLDIGRWRRIKENLYKGS